MRKWDTLFLQREFIRILLKISLQKNKEKLLNTKTKDHSIIHILPDITDSLKNARDLEQVSWLSTLFPKAKPT